ncbi:hypothetical protein SAMN05192575_101984 [Nocardioides alpinus]|uniref:Ig-like domain-containing protein n=1 Tax=Nocardioides alpinus TaxID=748909 RepID=A0A1I0WHT5_9ACTN|nr:hypothetical protein CXG46_21230 [Nocardioides alpinus]SFA87680.1 hypothetical protein SAMN05192575_101984 [Nocardioides alpinus]
MGRGSRVALPVLALQAVTSTSASAVDVRPQDQAPLSVAVTATGSVERAYAWSIEKAADAAVRSTDSTNTATFRYTVTARAGAMTESGWALAGALTVTNPNDGEGGAITADAGVVTTLGGGSSCTVVGGDDLVVPAAGQLTLPYTCTFASAPSGSGTVDATVSWDPAGEASSASAVGSAPGSFTAASETNQTVAVVDDRTVAGQRVVLDPSVTWSTGLVRTYTYDLALVGSAPGTCRAYSNTATLDQPSGADPTAVTTVQACAPEVLPAQAFGQATGSVKAGCQGTVRTRVSNRTAETVTYRLRVGNKVHRIAVRSLGHRKFVTSGRALAKVTLKVGSTRLDRIRIPQRCEAPMVLPDTGLRAASS